MKEQRRHQRIRFNSQLLVRIGQFGSGGVGELENLSVGGLMLRTDMPLRVGDELGCEFSVCDSWMIDLSAQVVSRVGELLSARFHSGPLTERVVHKSIEVALAAGQASKLSVNEVQGRKILRVAGGFCEGLRNDFLYSLTRMGVDEIDLSEVTGMDAVGIELLRLAVDKHKVDVGAMSACACAVVGSYS